MRNLLRARARVRTVIGGLALVCIPLTPAFGQCTLNGASNPCTLYGPVTVSSGYLGPAGTFTTSYGVITNTSNIQITAGSGSNAVFAPIGSGFNTTLTGGGTLTLSSTATGTAYITDGTFAGGNTLVNGNSNGSSTIQGSGQIGNGSDLTLINNASGTITANVLNYGLALNGGAITNAGLLQAAGGTLVITAGPGVNNAGGNITATGSGSNVYVGTTIQGGTLNSSSGGALQTYGEATLSGVTLSSGSTYSGGSGTTTIVSGTITNDGNIQITSGGGNNASLQIQGAVTLQGGGTVTLGNSGGGGTALVTDAIFGGGAVLTNSSGNSILGYGNIGNSDLALVNAGTVNANVSGQNIILNGNAVTNTGLLESTGGGNLQISTNVNNTGGNITAGSGSTVGISSTIQGGTLNGLGLQTTNGSATLQGLTLSSGSVYTSGAGQNTGLAGTINNAGNFQITSGGGNNAALSVYGAVTLQGGGTVTLGNSGGGGTALITDGIFGGGAVLTNSSGNSILGYGNIGNSDLALVNAGTVNANVSGQSIILNGNAVTNTGLLESTGGGNLQISTNVNNTGGNITAGSGSTVGISSTIQGGTLNGLGLQTTNGSATLQGLTLSSGSVYTSGAGQNTGLAGTINNAGNFQVTSGGGNNALLSAYGAVTLQGGGSVTLGNSGGGGTALITDGIFGGNAVLTNNGNTIQGYGNIGNSDLKIVNGAGGTLLANVAGQTLLINGTGGLTNNGTMQANAGSTLLATQGFTNFSGNTLTGGTYNVNGTAGSAGTIQINALGTTGGEIVNNAASISLNGPNSNFFDANSLDALSAFANNLAAGSFTISGGRNFITSADTFSNAGLVDIGFGSAFTVGGEPDYAFFQSGGTTQVDGSLTASTVTVDGGTLKGTGTINGNVTVDDGGVTAPGDSPGTLTVNGNYVQGANGALDIVIGGASAGTQYSVLDDINGTVTLSGLLDLTSIGGFNPFAGETFDIFNFGSGDEFGQFSSASWANLTPGLNFSVLYNPTDVEVVVSGISQGSGSATPEPGTWILFGSALGGLCVWHLLRRKKSCA